MFEFDNFLISLNPHKTECWETCYFLFLIVYIVGVNTLHINDTSGPAESSQLIS